MSLGPQRVRHQPHPPFLPRQVADLDGTRRSPIYSDSHEVLLAVDSHERLHMRLPLTRSPIPPPGQWKTTTGTSWRSSATASRRPCPRPSTPPSLPATNATWSVAQVSARVMTRPGRSRECAAHRTRPCPGGGRPERGLRPLPGTQCNVDARWHSVSGWYSAETMGPIVIASTPTCLTRTP